METSGVGSRLSQCVDSTRVVCPLFQAEECGSIPTSTLQLRVFECPPQKAQALNAAWHSVLPDTVLGNLVRNRRAVFYTAQFGGVYYATAMWTDPVAANRLTDGDRLLELRRFAIAPDAPRYTGSWMLGVMARLLRKRFPELLRLISYQAKDHHAGTIYKAAGWRNAAESEFSVWHEGEHRNAPQTKSAKVRWERNL